MQWQTYCSILLLVTGAIAGAFSLNCNSFSDDEADLSKPVCVRMPGVIQERFGRAAIDNNLSGHFENSLSFAESLKMASLGLDTGDAAISAKALSALLQASDNNKSVNDKTKALLLNNLALSYLVASRTISDALMRTQCLELAHWRFQQSLYCQPDDCSSLKKISLSNDLYVLQELSSRNSKWKWQLAKTRQNLQEIERRNKRGTVL